MKRKASIAWRRGILHRIIRNPAYKGQHAAFRHKVVYKRRYDPLLGETQRYRTTQMSTEGVVPLPGTCPALVDDELWQAANDRLNYNKLTSPRNIRDPRGALLRGGFAICGYCGSKLMAERGKGGAYLYRCVHRSGTEEVLQKRCPGGAYSIPAAILDHAVWEETVLPIMLDTDNIAKLIEMTKAVLDSGDIHRDEREITERLLRRAEAEHAMLIAAIAQAPDEATMKACLKSAGEMAAQIGNHKASLERLEQEIANTERHKRDLEQMLEWSKQISGELSYDQKRLVLYFGNVKAKVYRAGATGYRARGLKRWDIEHQFTAVGLAHSVSNSSSSYQPETCSTGTCTRSKRVW